MSINEDGPSRGVAAEVVRLKVDGAKTVVNTLRDQQTARGISLVCPFPALEVEIPVSFGTGPSDSLRRGTVHRIGVEDDPETGLPRLRLSIRAHESRATMVRPPSDSLLDESSRMTEAPREGADTDLSVDSEVTAEDSCLDDMFDDHPLELAGGDGASDVGEGYSFLPLLGEEPAWVGCGELSLPEEIAKRTRKRTRRALTTVAAWTMVIGVAAAGVYVLKRTGVIDVENLKNRVAGFVTSDHASTSGDTVAEPVAVAASETAAPPAAPVTEPSLASELALDEVSVPDYLDLEEPSETAYADEPLAETAGSIAAADAEPVTEPAPLAESADGADEVVSDSEVSLMLPTRWPAEYTNAYRMRNPNGVVVDVPGGLVRREGWLDVGREHPMIKSIKAVQRETGARFVIFVNGELPRFMTTPRPGGVGVKLIREAASEPAETEQVALLD